ncbi:D-arabinitol 4-dehydrogenase [Diplonema papillatum]|nr:D-arabinitol 4-dehydrogenase [Diplonema papillatum]
MAPQSSENVWMHIGAGAFHRAHQAWFIHRLREEGGEGADWSIALGNVRDDATALLSALQAQGGKYTLETVSPGGERAYERITSIRKVLPWDPELNALREQGADPATKVISFTVTEAGYYLSASRDVNLAHPDVQADVQATGTASRTIYGALRGILWERMQRGGGPVTLLSCDNVRDNGRCFRGAFLAFLGARGPGSSGEGGAEGLVSWVQENTSCPNSMVDRITPRPTADVAERVAAVTKWKDQAPVLSEAFAQWVIQDAFASARPPLSSVGVVFAPSVEPWEEAKIRVLNASHSCLAWAGSLVGVKYIHQCAGIAPIVKVACEYVTDDVIPCLEPSPVELRAYRDTTFQRFENPYIRDSVQRVASDSLSKVPGFITPTLLDCRRRSVTPLATARICALCFLFFEAWHRGSLPFPYVDSALDAGAMHARFAGDDALGAFARDKSLFGLCAEDPAFEETLRAAVTWARPWLAEVKAATSAP